MNTRIKLHSDGMHYAFIEGPQDPIPVELHRVALTEHDVAWMKVRGVEDKPGAVAYIGGGLWLRREPTGDITGWREWLLPHSPAYMREAVRALKHIDEERDGLPHQVQAVAEWLDGLCAEEEGYVNQPSKAPDLEMDLHGNVTEVQE